jgi:hypothetical protein
MNARALCITVASLTILASSLPAQSKERLNAIVTADSVMLTDMGVHENCASRFAIRVVLDGTTLRIIQRDTIRDKARCMCEYTLTTVVRGLAPGQYEAEFEREYLAAFGYPADTTQQIGTIAFVVTNGVAGPLLATGRQGECILYGTNPPVNPFGVSVYPNPFTRFATIVIDHVWGAEVSIDIFDQLGERVMGMGRKESGGEGMRVLIHQGMFPSAGTYYCRVTSSEGNALVPFRVLK